MVTALLSLRSVRRCPEGRRGPRNPDVGKLQIVLSDLHRVSSAIWLRFVKASMTQEMLVDIFHGADVKKCRVWWGEGGKADALTFPDKVAEPPAAAAVCSSLRAALNNTLEAYKLQVDIIQEQLRSLRPRPSPRMAVDEPTEECAGE